MKKTALPLLALCAALALTGCAASPASSKSAASGSAPSLESAPDTESSQPVAGDSDWRDAYRVTLTQLCNQYGRFDRSDSSAPYTGVKFARLLDFDADGVRELVVEFDRTVQLYTYAAGEAKLLYEGEVGSRFGQTDVSYTFALNAAAEQPCLGVYHSEQEWTQEAIDLVRVVGGKASVTTLNASTPESGALPETANLSDFRIDGRAVTSDTYSETRADALDTALEIDVDWGSTPATDQNLSLVFAALDAEDADYILPNSDCVPLTQADLQNLSRDALRLARNELYARYGRSFQDSAVMRYFSGERWYAATYTPEEFDAWAGLLFTQCERDNLALIMTAEQG